MKSEHNRPLIEQSDFYQNGEQETIFLYEKVEDLILDNELKARENFELITARLDVITSKLEVNNKKVARIEYSLTSHTTILKLISKISIGLFIGVTLLVVETFLT